MSELVDKRDDSAMSQYSSITSHSATLSSTMNLNLVMDYRSFLHYHSQGIEAEED
jgi:hypothetical protein